MRRLLAVLLLFSCATFAQDLRSQLTTEIKQLRATAAAQPANDELWKDLHGDVDTLLNRADAAVSANRLYLGLDLIGYAQRLLQSFQNTQTKTPFQTAFDKDRATLVSLDAKARQRDWSAAPAAVRALAESSQGQALTLVDASKAYAEVTSPTSGFFYLGEAKADEQFATWVHALQVKRSGTPFHARDISSELDSLQQKVTSAFKPPASTDKHSEFIRLNSMLKTGTELNAASLHYGAAYQYLTAIQQFGMIDDATPSAEQQTKLREELVAARAKYEKSRDDDSLALMFVERAEEKLASADKTPANAKAAAAIVHIALPAYAELKTAAPRAPSKPTSDVVLTLVRWPYT